jgi:hypothetical protein
VSWEADGRLQDLFDPLAAERAVRDMADAAGAAAARHARELAPVQHPGLQIPGRPPGTLRESYRQTRTHRTRLRPGMEGYASGVYSDDPVAAWLEYGTPAHVIRAHGGKLRFRTISGEIVEANVVHVSGIRAEHIVGHALEATRAEFGEVAAPSLERWREETIAAFERSRRLR